MQVDSDTIGLSPLLAARPSAADIFRARIFEEPLVPMGGEPTPEQNVDLAAALLSYAECDGPGDFSALTEFLDTHPDSPWAGGLLTNLGLVYYRRGYYSLALQAWRNASTIAMTITAPAQKPLTDRAIGELAYMLAKVGRVSGLEALLESVADRGFSGLATQRIVAATDGLAQMRVRPEVSFRCGPMAQQLDGFFQDRREQAWLPSRCPQRCGAGQADLGQSL